MPLCGCLFTPCPLPLLSLMLDWAEGYARAVAGVASGSGGEEGLGRSLAAGLVKGPLMPDGLMAWGLPAVTRGPEGSLRGLPCLGTLP